MAGSLINITATTPEVLARDAAEHGASIGFTRPLADGEVADYGHRVGPGSMNASAISGAAASRTT